MRFSHFRDFGRGLVEWIRASMTALVIACSMNLHPLKLSKVAGIAHTLLREVTYAHSPACTSAREAFRENMARAMGISSLPGYISLFATALERSRNITMKERGAPPEEGTPLYNAWLERQD